ncbi:MAG: DUF1097 family protein [Clostridiales bacterium]|jgi:hypothetical protein|nr:DUF1097 family protein [Clostridiales bacterium]
MYIKKFDKGEFIVTFVVFLWIFVVNVAAVIIGIESWPMFFVAILFFLLGNDTKQIPKILCGAVLGLILAVMLAVGLQILAPSMGILGAFALLIFIILAIIILGGTVLPVACNNCAFAYLTIAAIRIEEFTFGGILNNFLVLIIGGAIILGGALLCMNFTIKALTPKS